MRAGCALAMRFPGSECEARFPNEDRRMDVMLVDARRDGWELWLKCQRHHQGLKSAQPCRAEPIQIDLTGLIAALGHDTPIDQLPRKICCPGCGSRSFTVSWVVPKKTAAA